jgi:hypothetical protein
MTSEDRASLLKAITEGTVPDLTAEERDHLRVVVETVEQVCVTIVSPGTSA